ncbi:MAG TPA: ABC transporter ATP-binding protein [Anaerolineae bacterium]|nr:ABC transporter ATP-binding protein [Anaerolineae bacterium]
MLVEQTIPPTIELHPAHLRLDGVTKKFENVTAVNRITLDIPRGSFATLLGPSGCGKTTLLRMIAGFYEPEEGAIYLDTRRIDQLPAHRRGTAMVFQDYALFPHMTVYDNVAYGLRLAKLASTEIERRVKDTLEFAGLGGLANRFPNQLSGGQQQRVALARALVVQPEVLLLDEPLSNLDANLREQLRWELRAIQRRLNLTFVYVTHDQSEALAMSDWIAVLRAGRVEQWGTPFEIYNYPTTPFMAQFVGSANLRSARVLTQEDGKLVVMLNDSRLTLAHGARHAVNAEVGGEVLLCIRPETIGIGPTAMMNDALPLRGRVTRSAFLGYVMRYWVDVAGAEWIVDQADPGSSAAFEGEVVLSIKPERVHVIQKPEA